MGVHEHAVGPDGEEIRLQMEKVCDAWKSAPIRCDVLRFIVNANLEGRQPKAVEIRSGLEKSIDANGEAQARGTVGEIRNELALYFNGAGKHDLIILDLPIPISREGYAVKAHWRQQDNHQKIMVDPLPAEPESSHTKWFQNWRELVALLVGSAGLIYNVYLIFQGALAHQALEDLVPKALWAHLIAIVTLLFCMHRLPDVIREADWSERGPAPNSDQTGLVPMFDPEWKRTRNAVQAAKQFHYSWRSLWLTWFGLYLVFLWAPPVQTKDPPYTIATPSFWEDILNLANAGAFFLCYYAMVARTTGARGAGKAAFNIFKTVLATIVVSVALPLMATRFAWFKDCLPYIEAALTGLAVALLAGRLESPLVGSPTMRGRHIVALGLYVYALVQVLYAVLASEHALLDGEKRLWAKLITTAIALGGKVLLYWYVEKTLIRDGGIYWYMLAYRKDYDDNGAFVACHVTLNGRPNELREVAPQSGAFAADAGSSSSGISRSRRLIAIGRKDFLREILVDRP
jgi:hypothetical protein